LLLQTRLQCDPRRQPAPPDAVQLRPRVREGGLWAVVAAISIACSPRSADPLLRRPGC